jgi:serine/threonine protein kinase
MLTDFGLARAMDDAALTRSTVIAGTPQYMSPEQAQGDGIDHRTDLFSLGSVIYTMCTGHPPFRAETLMGVLRRITDGAPREAREVNSDVPAWLAAIIAKLHAREPANRFQSAADLATLLEQCLAHLQQPTLIPLPHIPGVDQPTRTRQSWFRLSWIAASLTLVAVGVTAIGMQIVGLGIPGTEARLPTVLPNSTNSVPTTNPSKPALFDNSGMLDWRDGLDLELMEIEGHVRRIESQAETN